MTRAAAPGVRSAVTRAAVEAFFEHVFAVLDSWQGELIEHATPLVRSGGMSSAQLESLVEPFAAAALDDTTVPIYGAGFVATPALLTDNGNPLAWWQGEPRTRLVISGGFEDRTYIEYQRLEWFRLPQQTGARHVAGPYVDYLCSTEITMTSALPLVIDGEFLGVSCTDVLVETVERCLLPELERTGDSVTLANTAGRVVISSDPTLATGDHIDVTPSAATAVASCANLPLVLVAPV